MRIHIVAGMIHRDICKEMIDAAKRTAPNLGIVIDKIVWVPGSLEAPLAVQTAIKNDRPDGIVVFGVQQKGKTNHGEVIAHQVTSKLLDIQLAFTMPMAIAIIGPGATLEHAQNKAVRTAEKALRAIAHMMDMHR
ncbi:MAG: hypothetical protein HOD87_05100 [Gammaproteobacteria bacterium]|jgi:6,7-dimethyl-8-ribityllumazine synthase|nr:hypothetical protein [Gammaproteobacteria bacterium]